MKQLLTTAGVALVELELFDANGVKLSSNFYWQANVKGKYKRMDEMPVVKLKAMLQMSAPVGREDHLTVQLTNSGATPALAVKLTLKNAATGERILPAYYSDNYASLMPGEAARLTLHFLNLPRPAK